MIKIPIVIFTIFIGFCNLVVIFRTLFPTQIIQQKFFFSSYKLSSSYLFPVSSECRNGYSQRLPLQPIFTSFPEDQTHIFDLDLDMDVSAYRVRASSKLLSSEDCYLNLFVKFQNSTTIETVKFMGHENIFIGNTNTDPIIDMMLIVTERTNLRVNLRACHTCIQSPKLIPEKTWITITEI